MITEIAAITAALVGASLVSSVSGVVTSLRHRRTMGKAIELTFTDKAGLKYTITVPSESTEGDLEKAIIDAIARTEEDPPAEADGAIDK